MLVSGGVGDLCGQQETCTKIPFLNIHRSKGGNQSVSQVKSRYVSNHDPPCRPMFYMFFLLETSIAILFDQRVTVWPWVPLGSTSAKMIPTFHRFSGIAMILFPYQIQ